MKKKQLSEYIGNIDDRLVQQAQQIPGRRRRQPRKIIRRFAAAAAVLALMICSFSVGALAFARETIVEISDGREAVKLEDIQLTLLLPDSWSGLYSVVKDRSNYIFYNKQIREVVSPGIDAFDGGVLFYIVCYEEAMTPEQFVANGYDFTEYRYLFSTRNKTYILHYASDVQWDPEDPVQENIYQQMTQEIKDIRFIMDNVLED